MSKVKIGFAGLSVTEQIERARHIKTSMTGNTNYTTPSPTLIEVEGAVTALENAYNESRSHDKVKVAAMSLRRKELLFMMSQEAAYVQQASGGDMEKIQSSGFDVVKTKTTHSDTAGMVTNVRLSDGASAGKIRVDFDKAENSIISVILVAHDAEFTDMEPKGITTKTHKEIGPFKPGEKIWVKVVALGREEAGTPSEPVSILVR